MFGWVGELASAFASIGPWGLILLTLLIIVVLLVRANARQAEIMFKMHDTTLQALDRSTDSHHGVARVLGRIEGILGLKSEDES